MLHEGKLSVEGGRRSFGGEPISFVLADVDGTYFSQCERPEEGQ